MIPSPPTLTLQYVWHRIDLTSQEDVEFSIDYYYEDGELWPAEIRLINAGGTIPVVMLDGKYQSETFAGMHQEFLTRVLEDEYLKDSKTLDQYNAIIGEVRLAEYDERISDYNRG